MYVGHRRKKDFRDDRFSYLTNLGYIFQRTTTSDSVPCAFFGPMSEKREDIYRGRLRIPSRGDQAVAISDMITPS